MATPIYLASSEADGALAAELGYQLTSRGYNICQVVVKGNLSNWGYLGEVERLILFITPNSDNDLYTLARHRNMNGVQTVNYFPQPFPLTHSQHFAVGPNRSVFVALYGKESVNELCSLLGETSEPVAPQQPAATQPLPQPAPVQPAPAAAPAAPAAARTTPTYPQPTPAYTPQPHYTPGAEEKEQARSGKKTWLYIVGIILFFIWLIM